MQMLAVSECVGFTTLEVCSGNRSIPVSGTALDLRRTLQMLCCRSFALSSSLCDNDMFLRWLSWEERPPIFCWLQPAQDQTEHEWRWLPKQYIALFAIWSSAERIVCFYYARRPHVVPNRIKINFSEVPRFKVCFSKSFYVNALQSVEKTEQKTSRLLIPGSSLPGWWESQLCLIMFMFFCTPLFTLRLTDSCSKTKSEESFLSQWMKQLITWRSWQVDRFHVVGRCQCRGRWPDI